MILLHKSVQFKKCLDEYAVVVATAMSSFSSSLEWPDPPSLPTGTEGGGSSNVRLVFKDIGGHCFVSRKTSLKCFI